MNLTGRVFVLGGRVAPGRGIPFEQRREHLGLPPRHRAHRGRLRPLPDRLLHRQSLLRPPMVLPVQDGQVEDCTRKQVIHFRVI